MLTSLDIIVILFILKGVFFIKKLSFTLLCIFVCVMISACIYTPIIERADDVEKPFLDVSESEPVVLDPVALYDTAWKHQSYLTSFSAEDELVTEVTYGNETYTYKDRFVQKIKLAGTSAEVYSLTVIDDSEEGYTLTHSGKTAYFQNSAHAFSFDCTSREFDELVGTSMTVNGIVLYEDSFKLVESNSTCEVDDQGNTILSGSKRITDESEKNTVLGGSYVYFTDLSSIDLSVTVKFKTVKYIEQIVIKASFSADDGYGTVFYDITQKITYSEINNKSLDIPIPNDGCYYLGDYEALNAFASCDILNDLDGYSAKLRQEHISSGEGVDFNDHYEVDFVVSNDGNQSYADKITYEMRSENQKFVYYYYLEDGVEYYKYNNDIEYTDYEADYVYYDTVSLWMNPWFGLNIGCDFSYTDNGDGTASLEYKFTEDDIVTIIDDYLYAFYGDESVGAFNTISAINKADAVVVFDLESGVLIEQSYEIDISVYYDFKTISYRETRTVTVDTDNYSVPPRDQFFGTSDL